MNMMALIPKCLRMNDRTYKQGLGQTISMTDATTLNTKPTTELETLLAVIEGILQDREDSNHAPVNIGDSVSFDLRKNCSVKGTVLGKTEKRVKVQCSSIEGV